MDGEPTQECCSREVRVRLPFLGSLRGYHIADGDAHCGRKRQQEGKEDRHRDGNWLEEELVKTNKRNTKDTRSTPDTKLNSTVNFGQYTANNKSTELKYKICAILPLCSHHVRNSTQQCQIQSNKKDQALHLCRTTSITKCVSHAT